MALIEKNKFNDKEVKKVAGGGLEDLGGSQMFLPDDLRRALKKCECTGNPIDLHNGNYQCPSGKILKFKGRYKMDVDSYSFEWVSNYECDGGKVFTLRQDGSWN